MNYVLKMPSRIIGNASPQAVVATVLATHVAVLALLAVPEMSRTIVSSLIWLGELGWDQLSSPTPPTPAGDITPRVIRIWTNHVAEVELPRLLLAVARIDCQPQEVDEHAGFVERLRDLAFPRAQFLGRLNPTGAHLPPSAWNLIALSSIRKPETPAPKEVRISGSPRARRLQTTARRGTGSVLDRESSISEVLTAKLELLRCPQIGESARACALFSRLLPRTRKSGTAWRRGLNSNWQFRFSNSSPTPGCLVRQYSYEPLLVGASPPLAANGIRRRSRRSASSGRAIS